MTEWNALTRKEKGALIRPLIEIDGLTYSQIARKIGVSRVAIAGAARRNGLVSPYSPGNDGKNGHRKLKTSAPRSIIAPIQPVAPPGSFVDLTPIKAGAWDPLPDTTPKPLVDLGNNDCKWPIGTDSPHSFCGQPAAPDKVYCAAHAAIAYRPRPEEQRKKGTNHG